MVEKIIEIWRESTVIQGAIALISVGAVVYLALTGQQIPDLLETIVMAVLGFYFGQKSAQMAYKMTGKGIERGG